MNSADKLNSDFIRALLEKIPEGETLANFLMDILPLSREATYRRLRGDVAFTYQEIVTLSERLNISLDVLHLRNTNTFSRLDFNLLKHQDCDSSYEETIDNYLELLSQTAFRSQAELWTYTSRIPTYVIFSYEWLHKLYHFKWLYQLDHTGGLNALDVVCDKEYFSESIETKRQELRSALENISKTVFIWDAQVFATQVNEINLFNQLGVLSPKDIEKLKEELLDIINYFRSLATIGKNKVGNEVHFYICPFNFGNSYTSIQADNFQMSLIRVYDLNLITSENKELSTDMYEWIKSLRKFSDLISQSSDLQRNRFFREQEEIVRNL